MIKEFIKGLEKFLLVRVVEFFKERGVVGFALLFHKASTDFVLAVVCRIITLLLESSTKRASLDVFLVHPSRIVIVFEGGLL